MRTFGGEGEELVGDVGADWEPAEVGEEVLRWTNWSHGSQTGETNLWGQVCESVFRGEFLPVTLLCLGILRALMVNGWILHSPNTFPSVLL